MAISVAGPAMGGQWFERPGETRWWFDAGSLALNFANTGALPDGVERFHAPDDLARWLRQRFGSVGTDLNERELSDALGLRDAIAGLALCAVQGRPRSTADVDILNLFAAMADVPPALDGGTRQVGASQQRAQHALSSIARDAIRILRRTEADGVAHSEATRIRQCSAPDCDLVYLDTSRSGNRRWCSMQRCGNRAKVRAHRARTTR